MLGETRNRARPRRRPCCEGNRAMPRERGLPGRTQSFALRASDVLSTLVEELYNAPRQLILFSHSLIPCLSNIAASAWVAREQCVFTLPSEQPMTFAAS